jgi:AcrR family transcriptional regulator
MAGKSRPAASARPTELRTAAAAIAPIRGRVGSLNLPDVIRVGLRVLDAEGLAALTMRRVAKELGVGVATVYAAVGGKDELLTAMSDAVMDELPPPELSTADHLDVLASYLLAYHRLMVEHPAVAQLSAFRQSGGASALQVQENLLSLLYGIGVPDDRVVSAYTTLTSYVLGFTLRRIPRADAAGGSPLAGVDPVDFPRLTEAHDELEARKSDDNLVNGIRLIVAGYLRP